MMVKSAYEKLLTLHFIHLTHRSPFKISKEMESTIIKMFVRAHNCYLLQVCSTVISINLWKKLFSYGIAVDLIETKSERMREINGQKRERKKSGRLIESSSKGHEDLSIFFIITNSRISKAKLPRPLSCRNAQTKPMHELLNFMENGTAGKHTKTSTISVFMHNKNKIAISHQNEPYFGG